MACMEPVRNSFFPTALYVLFSALSVQQCREEIDRRIPKDSSVLVFDIEGTLFSEKNPVFEKERVICREMYKRHATKDSLSTLGEAYYKHLSVPKLFYEEFGIHPKDFWKEKSKIEYELYLERDSGLNNALHKAKAKEFHLVVWSSNNLEITQRILKTLGIENVFDIIFYATEDVEEGFLQNPISEANDLLADLLKIDRLKRVVVFNQSGAGVDSARVSEFEGIRVDHRNGIVYTIEDFLLADSMYSGLHEANGRIRMPYKMGAERHKDRNLRTEEELTGLY